MAKHSGENGADLFAIPFALLRRRQKMVSDPPPPIPSNPPGASRTVSTKVEPEEPKDLTPASKTFGKSVLANATKTARLTRTQAYGKKLEFVDLRQADYRIGQKAYESGLSIPGHENIISQLDELRASISALKDANVSISTPATFADKAKAAVNAAANAAKVEALTFKQKHLLIELGSKLRQSASVEGSLAAEIEAAKLIFERIKALDSDIEKLGSGTYWWARRPLWIVAALLIVGAAGLGVWMITSLSTQWEIEREKQHVKAQFDAYQQGATALMDAMKRRQADATATSSAAWQQQQEAQRKRDEALRQDNDQRADAWRKMQEAKVQEQNQKQQAIVEQDRRAKESQQREQTAAEARQNAKREQLAKLALTPSANESTAPGANEDAGGSPDSPETTLAATSLGKWTRDQQKSIISADGSRTVVVLPNGSRVQAWVDGHPGPACRDIFWRPKRDDRPVGSGYGLPISPDYKRVAYLAALDGGGTVVVTETAQSPIYKEVSWIGYGPKGHHLAYVVKIPDETPFSTVRADRMFMVDNGNAGLVFSRIEPESITFSADGQHLAFIALTIPPRTDPNRSYPEQYCVVVDGKDQRRYRHIEQVILSRDGSHYAYLTARESNLAATQAVVDGKESPIYKSIQGLRMSDDGSRCAFINQDSTDKQFVVDNGNAGAIFTAIGELVISGDGQRLAYVAQKRAGDHTDTFVVDNGASGIAYDGCSQLQISPDGGTLSYVATAAQRYFLVTNGKEFGPFTFINTSVAFSPDGNHWACGVQDANEHYAVLLDGELKPSVPINNRGDSLTFNSDNQRVTLHTDRAGNKVEI